ncbi:MAG: hypothetical protein ACJZ9F_00125 [Rhodospirillaceae bacterium]
MTQTASQPNVAFEAKDTHIEAKLRYFYDDTGESGREWITLTANSEGMRTVRTLSELDDVGLQRNAIITYSPSFRAQDGYIHMMQNQAFLGSGWFRFGENSVALEAETALEGRISQRMVFDEPIGIFAPHPVFLDGWHCTLHNPRGPTIQNLRNCITSSPHWHGASGPLICAQHRRIERLPDEEVTVKAGTFMCESYHLIPQAAQRPPIKFWVHGPHKILVRLRWDFLKATYELTNVKEHS